MSPKSNNFNDENHIMNEENASLVKSARDKPSQPVQNTRYEIPSGHRLSRKKEKKINKILISTITDLDLNLGYLGFPCSNEPFICRCGKNCPQLHADIVLCQWLPRLDINQKMEIFRLVPEYMPDQYLGLYMMEQNKKSSTKWYNRLLSFCEFR